MEEIKNCDKMAHHVSIVPCDRNGQPCLDKLSKSLPKSGKKYLCPFCTPDKYKPAWPSKVKKHLTSHDHHINLKDVNISVLACHLDCRAKKKDKHAHYHCPSCYKTLARKDGFYTHWEDCKQYYTAPSDLAKHEDSGCFSCSDEDTTTENRIESKYCEESMNTVSSIQANSFDMPDVSYLSHGTHTNSESVACSEGVMMDVDVTGTVYSTEGITLNVTSPPLKTPIAESQPIIAKKPVQPLTCTPTEEISLQSQSSVENQRETIQQSHAEHYNNITFSKFQESRHTRQDSGFYPGQVSMNPTFNQDGNDKMESDVAPNMMDCQEIINELSPLNVQKLFDEIEGLDYEGKCFGVDDYWPLSNDPGGSSEGSEKKVESWEDFPDSPEVDLPVHPWDINKTDISPLLSFIHGDGSLEDISVHGTTEMDEIDTLKMRGQYDRIDRVELL